MMRREHSRYIPHHCIELKIQELLLPVELNELIH